MNNKFDILYNDNDDIEKNDNANMTWTLVGNKKSHNSDKVPKINNNHIECHQHISQLNQNQANQINQINQNNSDLNFKKVLCNNIINNGMCNYDNKCLYAHSIAEQNIEPIRKIVYDMIIKGGNLSGINLQKNKELYRNLFQLTKLCDACSNGKCPGGYNCKFGANKKEHQLCAQDLVSGNCIDTNCELIHLTARGLTSYNGKFESKQSYSSVVKNSSHIQIPNKIYKYKSKINVPTGILLTDDYFKENNKFAISESNSDSDSDLFDDFENLSDDSDKSCEESIFNYN
jgi:hypothetical protein